MRWNEKKIRNWMEGHDYDGILLSRRDNFSWITEGAHNHVCTNTENGVAFLVIRKDGMDLIADSSDCRRMSEEQNPLHANAVEVPWYLSMEEFLRSYTAGGHFGSDTGIAGTENIQPKLMRLRMTLSPEEEKRYEELGETCSSVLENICMEAEPGMTEREIADSLKERCIKEGISPDCVLMGADERILKYRHPVPTDTEVKKQFMLVLGGEKGGQNISMTRMVSFGPVPEEISERYGKTAFIFSCMQKMMKEGMRYGEYFDKLKELYADAGYPDEWKKHHQGGPTGYACREFVIKPETEGEIHLHQAYAWNPTINGTKCEETTLLLEDGVKILTASKKWPRTEYHMPYGDFSVADILKR